MKRYRFGTPEKLVPSVFCKEFSYRETPCSIPESRFCFRQTKRGAVLEFEISPDTQIFGGGLQFHTFNHTGRKLALKCNADPCSPCGDTHAPVPLLVTNQGYGLYFDTARNVEFYCGIMKRGGELKAEDYQPSLSTEELYRARELVNHAILSVCIPNCEGIDVYVIEGNTITEIVAQYNMLSGGGCAVTEQSLGVLYRVNGTYTDEQALGVARYMRENRIPCDTLGLEPGWQTHAYPCTYVWNPERYPDPAGFIQTLRDMGYEVNLWEHAYVHPASPIYNEILPYACDYSVFLGLVPDFSIPEAREIFVKQQKTLTAVGVTGFKADECDGSDNTGGWSFPDHAAFPSGLDGEQYHNLFGVLYAQTMHEALDFHPGLSEIRSMGALAASYPFVLYSDLYNHKDFIRALVNSGFSGLLWAPEFRAAASKEEVLRRLQTAVFSVHCLINAWSNPQIPWLAFDCVEEVRTLLELRHRLIPRLMRAFSKYQKEGVPPVRALVMDYTDDPETWHIDDEYLFCEDLLVAPITVGDHGKREVYLPAGIWSDFYTGEQVPCGRFSVETEQIPVYVKQ